MQQTGLRKTTLYELQKEGSFPMRIQVTSNSVGWIEEEVNAWPEVLTTMGSGPFLPNANRRAHRSFG
jgi:predicted DNA-binding transcriptional regulator AlpA